ncbi:hypothetical protein ACUOFC_55980, partial [Escherichia sp. TWPC-MK]
MPRSARQSSLQPVLRFQDIYRRSVHDPKKIYAAFKKAQETKGKATVILAHTIKGYGMGDAAEGKNIA